jgi:hypothetical protein
MKNQIKSEKLYWATFNYFELRLPGECVLDCAHQGQCYDDCKNWVDKIKAQVGKDNFTNKPTADKIKKELAEYGAWDDGELNDENENWIRLIWCAANNIMEDDEPDCSKPVKKTSHI